MIYADLTPDNKWIRITSDSQYEMADLQQYFTKKINDWYILKKKHPYMNVDVTFMNTYNMIPVGLWMELGAACKLHNYDLQFSADFESRITNTIITKEGFENYVENLFAKSKIKPYRYQIDSAYAMLKYKKCCIELATGSGKTLTSYILFRYMRDVLHLNHILFITPKTNLTTQSSAKFKKYDEGNGLEFDWTMSEIHAKAKKKEKYDDNIVFGNYQSVCHKKSDFFKQFDVIINDETHHGVCTSVQTIMSKCDGVQYRIGMTGTFPPNGSYDNFTLQSTIGPVVYKLTSYELINIEKSATPVHVVGIRLKYLDRDRLEALYNLRKLKDPNNPTEGNIILKAEEDIVRESYERFRYICNMISKTTKNSLVLYNDIKNQYGRKVYQYLKENTDKDVFYIDGEVDTKLREVYIQHMEDDVDENTIIVASVGCFSEGIDTANLWNIFLIETTKSDNQLAQILGRGMRNYEGKDRTMLIDFIDDFSFYKQEDLRGKKNPKTAKKYLETNYLLRHGEAREEIYKRRGFPYQVMDVDIR